MSGNNDLLTPEEFPSVLEEAVQTYDWRNDGYDEKHMRRLKAHNAALLAKVEAGLNEQRRLIAVREKVEAGYVESLEQRNAEVARLTAQLDEARAECRRIECLNAEQAKKLAAARTRVAEVEAIIQAQNKLIVELGGLVALLKGSTHD